MPETSRSVAEQLHAIATLVRDAHFGPEGQRLLAELLEELSVALQSPAMPSAEVEHLTECTTHLIEAVHREDEEGTLGRARDRLAKAIAAAETSAPVAAGLARRLMEALANLGI